MATATEPTLIAFGDLNPSGLAISNPFRWPLPENTDTSAASSFTGTFSTMGPTFSTPALTTEPNKTNPKTKATKTARNTSPRLTITIFFIPKPRDQPNSETLTLVGLCAQSCSATTLFSCDNGRESACIIGSIFQHPLNPNKRNFNEITSPLAGSDFVRCDFDHKPQRGGCRQRPADTR